MQERLTSLDGEFKSYHFNIVALLEEEDLENAQAALQDHNDRVTGLFDYLVLLVTLVESEVKADPQQHLLKRLQHLSVTYGRFPLKFYCS